MKKPLSFGSRTEETKMNQKLIMENWRRFMEGKYKRDDDPGENPEPEEEAPIEDEFSELEGISDEDLRRLAAALEDAAHDWYEDEDPYDAGY